MALLVRSRRGLGLPARAHIWRPIPSIDILGKLMLIRLYASVMLTLRSVGDWLRLSPDSKE
jgi:hypothetical protein